MLNESGIIFNLVLWHFWDFILCDKDSSLWWDDSIKCRCNYQLCTVVNERKWFISVSCFWVVPALHDYSQWFHFISACWENQPAETSNALEMLTFILKSGFNADESTGCFENSLWWCFQGHLDVGDLSVRCWTVRFKYKNLNSLHPFPVFNHSFFMALIFRNTVYLKQQKDIYKICI